MTQGGWIPFFPLSPPAMLALRAGALRGMGMTKGCGKEICEANFDPSQNSAM